MAGASSPPWSIVISRPGPSYSHRETVHLSTGLYSVLGESLESPRSCEARARARACVGEGESRV